MGGRLGSLSLDHRIRVDEEGTDCPGRDRVGDVVHKKEPDGALTEEGHVERHTYEDGVRIGEGVHHDAPPARANLEEDDRRQRNEVADGDACEAHHEAAVEREQRLERQVLEDRREDGGRERHVHDEPRRGGGERVPKSPRLSQHVAKDDEEDYGEHALKCAKDNHHRSFEALSSVFLVL